MVKSMRRMMSLLMVGLISIQTIGCASWTYGRSSKSFLHESGVLLLSKKDDVVEVDSDYELSAKWLVAGRFDSTRALLNGNSRPVRASVVEANSVWILLKSPSWQKREDLPAEYLRSPDLYIKLRREKGKETMQPVIGIPVAQLTEISLYRGAREVEIRESSTVARSIVAGASGGFLFALSLLIPDNHEFEYDDSPTFVDFLVVGSIGVVVGAVGLPVYNKWKTWRAKDSKNTKVWRGWGQPLPIGEDDYTIRIKR